MARHWTGGCQCGAVRYELARAPKRTCICHCRMCQKASGQPFMAFATFDETDLRWMRGAPAVFRSSNLAQRGFCKDCGTPLFFKFEGKEFSIATGSLDDPTLAPPTVQFGAESEISWCAGVSALPRIRSEDDLGPELVAKFESYQRSDSEA